MAKEINEAALPSRLMICLRREGQQGKSGTIKSLAELLMPNPAAAKADWYEPAFPNAMVKGMPNTINGWPPKISNWKGDICVSVDIQKKLVGLCSFGDEEKGINDRLDFLVTKKCDIIFCACKSRRKTVGAVKTMAKKHGYSLIMTAPYTETPPVRMKTPTPPQKDLNMQKARHLKDFI